MEIQDIKNSKYLKEYIKLCNLEWGSKKKDKELGKYIEQKEKTILNDDKVICIKGLIENDILIGFISLFKYDGDERKDLTPWYATMYVKEKYRNMGLSKILNKAIIEEANKLGYEKVYLKTELENYYEKFNAKYMNRLDNGEKLYYIETKNVIL